MCAPRVLPNHSNRFDLRPNRYAQNSERTSNRSSSSRAAIWPRSWCIFRLYSFEVMSSRAEGGGGCLRTFSAWKCGDGSAKMLKIRLFVVFSTALSATRTRLHTLQVTFSAFLPIVLPVSPITHRLQWWVTGPRNGRFSGMKVMGSLLLRLRHLTPGQEDHVREEKVLRTLSLFPSMLVVFLPLRQITSSTPTTAHHLPVAHVSPSAFWHDFKRVSHTTYYWIATAFAVRW